MARRCGTAVTKDRVVDEAPLERERRAGIAERRSVTGGVVLLSGCCVANCSRTQASHALSSCEARHGKCSS